MKKEHLDAAYAAKTRSRRATMNGWLGFGAVLLLLFCGLPTIGAAAVGEPVAMAAALGVPLAFAGGLREADPGGPGGGGDAAVEDDPLAAKILARIAEQKAAVEEVERQVGEMNETKAEAEALQKAVADFDGLSSDVKTFMGNMAKLESKLANVRREASGDPATRLSRDEEMRTLITAPARIAYLRNHNRTVPKELLDAAQRMQSILEGKALTGGATPGSAYIDDELITTVYQLVASYGRWAGFDVLRPGARTVKLPVDTTDPTMIWATEGSAPSEASYAGSQVSLAIKKIYGWIGIANELLEDDEIGLAQHLATKFARATAKKLDHACFAADGTDDATHGDYEGIFPFGTAYDLGTGDVAISNVTFEDFIGLVAGADEALVESPNTRWWVHPQILVQLLGIKDSNGRPIFLTALEAPAAGGLGSILGYPVITANAAPKAVAAEAPIAAFGDAMGLAVAVRRDMEMAASVDAKFTEDQTVFRCRMRAGVKIKQATAFEVLTLGAASGG